MHQHTDTYSHMHTLSTHSNEAPVVTKSSRERRGSPKTSVCELSSQSVCVCASASVCVSGGIIMVLLCSWACQMYWEKEKEFVGGGGRRGRGGAAQSREGAQHQEQCSGEQTECYVNTLVWMCCLSMHWCASMCVYAEVCVCTWVHRRMPQHVYFQMDVHVLTYKYCVYAGKCECVSVCVCLFGRPILFLAIHH